MMETYLAEMMNGAFDRNLAPHMIEFINDVEAFLLAPALLSPPQVKLLH